MKSLCALLIISGLSFLGSGCSSNPPPKVAIKKFILHSSDTTNQFVLELPANFTRQKDWDAAWVMYEIPARFAMSKLRYWDVWASWSLPAAPDYQSPESKLYCFSSPESRNRFGVYIGREPRTFVEPDDHTFPRRVFYGKKGIWWCVVVGRYWNGYDYRKGYFGDQNMEQVYQCSFDTNLFVHVFGAGIDPPWRQLRVYPTTWQYIKTSETGESRVAAR